MAASDNSRIDTSELGRLLRAADPAALMVRSRLLRRVIKRDRKLTGLGLQVPHPESYVIGREALLALADRAELDLPSDQELPATLLLIARPEAEELGQPRGQVLVRFWRALFHASVHRAVQGRLAEQRLTEAAVRERIHRIGQAEFDEIRTVLRQEKCLLPPRDNCTAYEEFAALYLELRFFAATLLPSYFPAIQHFPIVDDVLAEDVDAAALFAATRPAGAPDPVFPVDVSDRTEGVEDEPVALAPSAEQSRDWMSRADRATAAGNVVRAAILHFQAGSPERAQDELKSLVARLQPALQLSEAEAEAWQQALPSLLARAARGFWPAEARLLYDLQKICVDHERPAFSPDLVEWAYSGFRRPMVRPLPDRPHVLAVQHLRGAAGRLPSVRVAEDKRKALTALVRDAQHHAEERLRGRFRPQVDDSLAAVGLRPESFPEQIGRDKLVEELLDRVVERGFLNLGDVRDALARNELKLKDLSSPKEFFRGDPVIRVNRELADRATGVYRRGEFYLRWLQRGSSVLFGTRPGRWVILFLALPFLGAFATIVFAQEMLHLAHLPHHLHDDSLAVTAGLLGVFYLLLLHLPAFRSLVGQGFRAVWGAARTVLIDLPAGVLRLPPVRRIIDSWPFLFLVDYVLKPLPAAALAGAVLWWAGTGPNEAVAGGVVALVAASLFLNSRLGRGLEEAMADWGVRQWEYVSNLFPGVFRLVAGFFKRILEGVDRFFYAVDEWLRFRRGEGRLTLAVKTFLGFVWFLAAYVVRLYVNVFIEPTVNPLKHFPAVTVAAKLLVPFWVPLTKLFAMPLMFLGEALALIIAFINLHSLPGLAGFLVWELKENWRLYRANRPETLRPVVVGHHGETLARLLKPGFHSGTLPRLYAKLRRAERKAQRRGDWRPVRRAREALHHVEESVRHFANRELLAYLDGVPALAGGVHLARVETGSNRIRLELAWPALDDDPLELSFEEQSGWLLGCVSRSGWLRKASPDQKAVLAAALTGFYMKAGVDLVREQIEACFAPACPPYDLAEEGLIFWPGQAYEAEVVYNLSQGPKLRPRVTRGQLELELPTLEASQLLWRGRSVAWQDWVKFWELVQAGKVDPTALVDGLTVLPKES